MKRKAVSLDATGWTLAKGTHGGYPLLIRFRQFDASFPRGEFPERLSVFWSISQPDDNGLASQSEAVLLKTFEDSLVASVEAEPIAVLSVVLTCNGKREFVFHARDESMFLDSLNGIPQDVEPFPLRIHRHRDPGWAYFDAVVGDLRPAD